MIVTRLAIGGEAVATHAAVRTDATAAPSRL